MNIQNAEEAQMIAAWLASNKPTPCPTRYACETLNAAKAEVIVRTVTPRLATDILRLHKRGHTPLMISNQVDLDEVEINKFLRERKLRPNRFKGDLDDFSRQERNASIVAYYREHPEMSCEDIAKRYHLGRKTVRAILEKAGITPRTGGEVVRERTRIKMMERDSTIYRLRKIDKRRWAEIATHPKVNCSVKVARKIYSRLLEEAK